MSSRRQSTSTCVAYVTCPMRHTTPPPAPPSEPRSRLISCLLMARVWLKSKEEEEQWILVDCALQMKHIIQTAKDHRPKRCSIVRNDEAGHS